VRTLDELLALHPWPAEHAGERRQDWLWHFDLPVGVDDLWRIISDTSRLNRTLGVSEMKFEERGGVRWGSSKNGGVRHEWVEMPWNWVAAQWLESVRIYERGFMRVVYAFYVLEPLPNGTRLYVYFGIVPRGAVGATAVRVGFSALGKAYARVLPALAEQIARTRPELLVLPPPELPPGAAARLDAIGRGLIEAGLPADAVDRLVSWVRSGDEQDLYRIQSRERARAWRLDEDTLLRVCLHATRAGLLELSWDVVCPHCRGAVDEVARLGDLPAQGECEVCGIDFATDSAEAVEITFHVHASIREVPRRTFCSAEPAKKEHIRVQRLVPAGGAAVVTPRLPGGRWRTRLGGEKRYGFLDVVAAGRAGEIEWRASAAPSEVDVGDAPAIRLVNDTSEPRTFVIEAAQWTDLALRPGRLLSFPDFRDLFSREYLADDVQLAVGEQTILFTDVVGSTEMYARRGDPEAFVDVKRHFAEVFEIIRRHRGAVVKTIGDAAMGAFSDPVGAVKAAKEIHDAFPPERADTPVRLRVSIHTGPCLAVKLNADIDYFGHTVNLSAKLQSLVEAWQVALSDATYRAPGVAEWLASVGARLEEIAFQHKALPAPVPVKRWTVHGRG